MYLLKKTVFLRPIVNKQYQAEGKITYRWIHLIITSDVFM